MIQARVRGKRARNQAALTSVGAAESEITVGWKW